MFVILEELCKNILVEPRFFGPSLEQCITAKLKKEVEGTCSGEYGFTIAVLNISKKDKGRLQPMTGGALFSVTYSAIVFKPEIGEVLDGVVTTIDSEGFWVEVGPLSVFVSKNKMPQDFGFDPLGVVPAYVSRDAQQRIEPGSEVRLRIVTARYDATKILCVGTIAGDYLGPFPQG
eukprot:c1516_g1_i1.p1 GENE.c1516_g1_i1~~c1516_g1_i1.p1  ORF type:complete len:176 (+),score=33.60 c1516_g1_i1:50-577(+)